MKFKSSEFLQAVFEECSKPWIFVFKEIKQTGALSELRNAPNSQ